MRLFGELAVADAPVALAAVVVYLAGLDLVAAVGLFAGHSFPDLAVVAVFTTVCGAVFGLFLIQFIWLFHVAVAVFTA